ncbi:MAG: radical SAM protein [Magnetococcales bacterium]|nr:radical SAM protein [Magnetococcales bacterium]NGZ06017.1 radical SAM protein [Magnetococcales bacterium]
MSENHNIVLVRSAMFFSSGRIGTIEGLPPLGLAYLAGYLRKNHINNLSILDAFGEAPLKRSRLEEFTVCGLTNEELLEKMPQQVAIVGISCMFSNEWYYTKLLIKSVKQKFPEAVIVAGGEHPTAMTEQILKNCVELDYIIRGEGEHAFFELVQTLLTGKGALEQIGGLARRENGEIVINPSTRLQELTALPDPAWDLVPIRNYLDHGVNIIKSNATRSIPIIASRGCPYTCRFCSNPQMWGKLYRLRPPQEVVNELKRYKDLYQINAFELFDLTFVMNPKWTIEFCTRLIEARLDLIWNIPNTRSEALNPEIVALLKKSGCQNISLSPESGSQWMLKDMEKRIKLPNMLRCTRMLARSGINTKVNMVIGFPGEKHRDVWMTLFYAIRFSISGVDSTLFYHFVPYPGSAYFKQVVERDHLPQDGDAFDRFLVSNIYNEMDKIVSYSEHISSTALKFYIFFGLSVSFLSFLLTHPVEIYRTINRLLQKKPKTHLEATLLNFFHKEKLS